MELIDELLDDAKERMGKSVESTRNELATVRTGRASPHLLDRLIVDYYGAETPLKQLAQVAATDARMLTVTPYDKSSIGAIEKAVMESDLGLTPSNDGNVIRLGIPELTEERRKEMVKIVHNVAEEGRVAVRNIRRDVMHDLRELKKEGDAGSDEEHRAESELQKQTDDSIERDRHAPQGQGRGDPRGLDAVLPEAPHVRQVRRDHHRRQRPLGPAARAARGRGPPGRRRRRQGAPARRRRARHRGADRVLVLDRELVAPARGGRGPDGDVRRAHRRRDPRAERGGRADALHRPPRRRLATSSRSGWTGPRPRPRATTASRCSSPSTTAAAPRSSTPRAAFEGGDEEEFRKGLYAPEMHDPDLLIRTSGEQRISNYLLWQCAYSEFVFRDELWPDFSREAFEDCAADLRGAPAALRGVQEGRSGDRPWTTSIRRPSGSAAEAGTPRQARGQAGAGSRRLAGRGGGAASDQGRAGGPGQRGGGRRPRSRRSGGGCPSRARRPRRGCWSRSPGSCSRSSSSSSAASCSCSR